MSELKVIDLGNIRESIEKGKSVYYEYYPKSEADKVIADLEESHKMEVEQLLILNREQANAANRLRDSMERVIRHHKYKRCLAMARWCETQFAYYIASCDRFDSKYVNKKAGHFYKWKYKWLELSEKFKEAK